MYEEECENEFENQQIELRKSKDEMSDETLRETLQKVKDLEQENAIFWQNNKRYFNEIQYCKTSLPCTFRGQISIGKFIFLFKFSPLDGNHLKVS